MSAQNAPVENKDKEKKESTAKRDYLRNIEISVQKEWEASKIFEEDAPQGIQSTPDNKFLGTFPYPYMNGRMHLGHTFTLTKVEYAAQYQRLKGKHVLFPFGFHCTGMPIKACADKLKREIEQFGNPPIFPEEQTEQEEQKPKEATKEDPTAFHSQKSKAQSKAGTAKYQWQIMRSNGVPEEEIPKFADANYWLYYFPPHCMDDLKSMGLGVDWRRSFITTDVNPYYDSFVRWQFEHLYEKKKVLYGKRYTIYSPKDGGPCADHDRQTGEGVAPQEYTLIKVELVAPYPEKLKHLEGKYKVYLVPGTLRPETMYGQTNVWVKADIEYGAFEINDTEAFICTERAARNLAYQGHSKEFGKTNCLAKITGEDIMGIPVKAPLTKYEVVYTLPMPTISPDKGTGIVTSVPSDAPDDWICLEELRRKPDYVKLLGLKPEMVMPYEIIPIIEIPGFGTTAAADVCKQLKIKSPKDRALLDQAKEQVYQKGFYEGIMIVGPHKGKSVKDAKPLIKEEMIAAGQAVVYSEPASQVISRSGEACVVALTDQWYIDYGEPTWKAAVIKNLKKMDMYSPATANKFDAAVDWLDKWACSRTYGLGTRLPWDTKFLIESLSDSTIYMSFYAVAHLLQGGVIDGAKTGPAGITAEQMTRPVWDYILLNGEYPKNCGIPEETLKKLRAEFEFWYPVDIRVSGKDLITNHLVFMLYNHTAIWPDDESKWPRGVRANGHVLLNGEKMSKSTGNFMTLTEAIDSFSADGMRFALADAGDSLDDANFTSKTATMGLLRLHSQIKWVEDTIAGKDTLRTGPPSTLQDRIFDSQINKAIVETDRHYDRTNFREALRVGFYDLQAARDAYRVNTGPEGMNKDLLMKFIEIQALLICPICPHFAEHLWKLLGKTGFARKALWPQAGPVDHDLLEQSEYLEFALHAFRLRRDVYINPPAKKGAKPEPVAPPTKATILVAKSYPEQLKKVLQITAKLVEKINPNTNSRDWPDEKELLKELSADEGLKKNMKKVMSFVATVKEEFKQKGTSALNLELKFDERALLESVSPLIQRSLDLKELTFNNDETAQNCSPGKPWITFES